MKPLLSNPNKKRSLYARGASVWFVLVGMVIAPLPVMAINYNPDNVVPNPTGLHTFTELLAKITNYLNLIVDPLVVIMVLWGGFQILTAAGDEAKFKKGKQTLTYAAIGAIIIICASGLIYIINEFLGIQTPAA